MVHYILDGYNIIQSGPDWLLVRGTLQAKREFLLGLLNAFLNSARGETGITAVFDGPESVPFFSLNASSSYSGRVEVLFSEGKTADKRIEDIVLKSQRPPDMVVVTNDKGIRRLLGGTGAKFMSVDEFVGKLAPLRVPPENQSNNAQDISAAEKLDKEFKALWLKRK